MQPSPLSNLRTFSSLHKEPWYPLASSSSHSSSTSAPANNPSVFCTQWFGKKHCSSVLCATPLILCKKKEKMLFWFCDKNNIRWEHGRTYFWIVIMYMKWVHPSHRDWRSITQCPLFLSGGTLDQQHQRRTQEQLYDGKGWVCCPHPSLSPFSFPSASPSTTTTTHHTLFSQSLKNQTTSASFFSVLPEGWLIHQNWTCRFRCL